MKNLIFIVVMVAALVLLGLYVFRVKTVPADVKHVLDETGQGATVTTMTKIPAAAKRAVEAANRTADSNMHRAMETVGDK